jgi:spore coat protein F
MNTITDKDILNTLLNDHKLSASAMMTLVLESSNQCLRDDGSAVLNRTIQHQKQIFDLMSQKGWYTTQPANQQDIVKAKQEVATIQ